MKRIPCRVVRSVPFNSGDAASRASRSSDIDSGGVGGGFVDVEFERFSDSGGWMFGPGAAKTRFAESFEGFALDFLA